MQKELADANEKLQRLVRSAEKFGQRVEPKHSLEQIQRQIKINERKIAVISSSNETMTDVEQRLQRLEHECKTQTDVVDALQTTLTMVGNTQIVFTPTLNFQSVIKWNFQMAKSAYERSKNAEKLMSYMKSSISWNFTVIYT